MTKQAKIEVILDSFSGKPNPAWKLSRKQINELETKLLNLPVANPKAAPGLGYRGFVLTNLNDHADFPTQIKAYDSCLTIERAGKTTYHDDIHGIEDWLQRQAKVRGYEV